MKNKENNKNGSGKNVNIKNVNIEDCVNIEANQVKTLVNFLVKNEGKTKYNNVELSEKLGIDFNKIGFLLGDLKKLNVIEIKSSRGRYSSREIVLIKAGFDPTNSVNKFNKLEADVKILDTESKRVFTEDQNFQNLILNNVVSTKPFILPRSGKPVETPISDDLFFTLKREVREQYRAFAVENNISMSDYIKYSD